MTGEDPELEIDSGRLSLDIGQLLGRDLDDGIELPLHVRAQQFRALALAAHEQRDAGQLRAGVEAERRSLRRTRVDHDGVEVERKPELFERVRSEERRV